MTINQLGPCKKVEPGCHITGFVVLILTHNFRLQQFFYISVPPWL